MLIRRALALGVFGLMGDALALPAAQDSNMLRLLGISDIFSALNLYQPTSTYEKLPTESTPTETIISHAPTYNMPENMKSPDSFSLAKMICLVNKLRMSHNLYPLVYHDKLLRLAQDHAKFESLHRMVTHNDGAGQIGDRLTRLGFQWSVLAENVGAGASDEDGIMDAWAKSPRHLANILHPDIRYLGVGVSNGYWVQDFAAPMNKRYSINQDQIDYCPSSGQVSVYI
ncbi:hypothetical protein H4R23_002623 [Coemansia sp. Cherry 401B]|nr:hypothetical protein IWW52_002139 [Coemansia sp. RSA 2704]KAJ2733411.1 hypothetical protein H4R23_002623 [Coemansia sp. Cherry 401B]